ncbi:MAG: hypothetical protein KDA41_15680 [Planctomycetales bacterium]|nr:hypothetical protein [Planctomycetales bacterium]
MKRLLFFFWLLVPRVCLAHEGHAEDADGGWIPLALLGVGVAAAVVVLLVIARMLRRTPKPAGETSDPLAFDVSSVADVSVPTDGPQLEIYNVPVRLVLFVLAPSGRASVIPPKEFLPAIVGAVAPHMMEVFESHQPVFRRWPAQLSAQGFAQMFFSHVPLPGDGGKGTPWCSVAGKVETPAGQFLVGMVGVAEKKNSLAQVALAHTRQWLDVLRVRAS